MDILCFFSVMCLLCLCVRLFICALWSPAGKGLTTWPSFVWYLIASIPDLSTLTYFAMLLKRMCMPAKEILVLGRATEARSFIP